MIVDVIEGLEVKLLIGTNFILYNGVKINLTNASSYFRFIYNIKIRV
jgi:hypothetical protein